MTGANEYRVENTSGHSSRNHTLGESVRVINIDHESKDKVVVQSMS